MFFCITGNPGSILLVDIGWEYAREAHLYGLNVWWDADPNPLSEVSDFGLPKSVVSDYGNSKPKPVDIFLVSFTALFLYL